MNEREFMLQMVVALSDTSPPECVFTEAEAYVAEARKRGLFDALSHTEIPGTPGQTPGGDSLTVDASSTIQTLYAKIDRLRGERDVAKVTERELRDEIDRTQTELFNLRCRAGCGPDQEGPDVWQQLDAAKALLREMAEYFARARPPIGTPTRWYIDRDKLIDRAKEMTDD